MELLAGLLPDGEAIFASGASTKFGQYSDAKADGLIKLTNTSSSLQSLYNYQELPLAAVARYLAGQSRGCS